MIKELHALRTFSASCMDEVHVRIYSYISQKVRSGSNCVAVVGCDVSIIFLGSLFPTGSLEFYLRVLDF